MIVYGDGLRDWIESKIGTQLPSGSQFLGRTRDGELVAVVAFANYTGDDVEIYTAAMPAGLSRQLLSAVFTYIWKQLGCTRCSSRVRVDNAQAIVLNERIGFRKEGLMRRACDGVDVLIMGMLKEECRYE